MEIFIDPPHEKTEGDERIITLDNLREVWGMDRYISEMVARNKQEFCESLAKAMKEKSNATE